MIQYILILYIILVSIISFYYIETKKEEFMSYNYRLGDMFLHSILARWGRSHPEKGFEFHKRVYPHSIATEYMEKTNKEKDYNILLDIVNNRKTPIELHDDTLSLHLRIGDIIDNSQTSVDTFLKKTILTRLWGGYINAKPGMNKTQKNQRNFVKPLKYYKDIVDEMLKNGIKKIILIGGFHTPHPNHKKSLEYVSRIKQFFEKKGFICETRIDMNPDDDFLIMCHSKFFTPSGGGFSDIIKNIVEMRGGKIIKSSNF